MHIVLTLFLAGLFITLALWVFYMVLSLAVMFIGLVVSGIKRIGGSR